MKLVLCFVFVNVTRRVQTAGGALMMMMQPHNQNRLRCKKERRADGLVKYVAHVNRFYAIRCADNHK